MMPGVRTGEALNDLATGFRGAAVQDWPDTAVPVYVAAGGPVVARYAARSGDGFICASVVHAVAGEA